MHEWPVPIFHLPRADFAQGSVAQPCPSTLGLYGPALTPFPTGSLVQPHLPQP